MKKISENIRIFLTVYAAGIFLALLINLLRFLGIIRILNWKRFPRNQGNLIVVANHPSLFEPILLPVLFWRDYLSHPFELLPMSTPDRKNFDKWFWFWAKPSFVFIDRDKPRETVRALHKMKKIVNSGGILILFGEGTRTFKAVERGNYFSSEKKGKKLGFLKEGVGFLVLKTNATVLPIWVDGAEEFFPNTIWIEGQKSRFPFPRFWKKVTVKIGKPLRFEKTDKVDIIQKVANTLLELADEEE